MRKKIILFVVVLFICLLLVLLGIDSLGVMKSEKTTNIALISFEECVAAGNAVVESYPRQCILDGVTFVEEIDDEKFVVGPFIECLSEQRDVDACIEIYQPVCGRVNIQCVTEPCEFIDETFENSCKACSNSLVEGYVESEC